MGENNWLLVKFQVKDPKSTSGAQGFSLSKNGGWVMAKKEIHIDCPQCGTPLDIEENIEDESSQSNTVWWDTGDKVVLIPREMLKYLEDSQGVLGFS